VEDPLSSTGIILAGWDLPVSLLGIALLLLASGLVSGAEIAFFSLTDKELGSVNEQDKVKAEKVKKLLQEPQKLLATVLIANNLINIALVIYIGFLSEQWINVESIPEWLYFFIQVIAVTFVILIFGEILPKVYAKQHSLKFAFFMRPALSALQPLLFWLIIPLQASAKLLNPSKRRAKNKKVDTNELSTAIELTQDDSVSEQERKIWKGIVELGKITVKETMTPRMDVVAIAFDTRFPDVLNTIREAGYSRMPVFRKNFDTIEGALYIKDLLPHLEESESFQWQKLIRPPLFVPENKPIDDLLREFQQKKMHLAIVVDEYGGSSGIVSLEDVLEEIVGEINDEFDDEDVRYAKLDKNTFVFDGKTSLIDLCRIMELDYDKLNNDSQDADTLAGLILNHTGSMPAKGRKIVLSEISLTVEAVNKKRIVRVKVSRNAGNSNATSVAGIAGLFILAGTLLTSCSEPQNYTPRPRGYPVIEIPEFQTQTLEADCPFTFEYQATAKINPYSGSQEQANACWFNIVYPRFNAAIYLTYMTGKQRPGHFADRGQQTS
jgi:putative hemolysin